MARSRSQARRSRAQRAGDFIVARKGDDFATEVDPAIERLVVDALVAATGIEVHDGDPVTGRTWLPFTGERYTAVAGGPLIKNGVPRPPLTPAQLADSIIGIGTFNVESRGRLPGRYRLAVRVGSPEDY